jgi:hypothetical protein
LCEKDSSSPTYITRHNTQNGERIESERKKKKKGQKKQPKN